MKKLSIVFLILINCIACSNGQTKSSLDNTQDLSTEILGCWRLVDAYYEVKSNYPDIDSIVISIENKYISEGKKNPYILKFFKKNISKTYKENAGSDGYTDNYKLDTDSLIIQNTIRKDDKMTSRIALHNDTMYLEADRTKEFTDILIDLKYDYNINIPKDIKLDNMIRYTILVRVLDCDQYKKEDE